MAVYTGYSPNNEAPSWREFIAMKIARAGAHRRAKQVSNTTSLTRGQSVAQALLRWCMQVAGFGCLTWAGYSINLTAGLIVAGISLFAISWLSTGERTASADIDPRR